MKYIKAFEGINVNRYLLCVKSTHKAFYWKFTAGKKYKLYISNYGVRIKDDENKFWLVPLISRTHSITVEQLKNGFCEIEYADGILTTDKSIEDYNIRKEAEKYNI